MQAATPSRTALGVAMRRAVHQLYDHPLVFDDPIALPILTPIFSPAICSTLPARLPRPEEFYGLAMRAYLVARSRYAEDLLAHAVQQGTTQYLILGAGLDTFAYRNPHPYLQVVEVDHPSTQAWKQELLREAGIALPPDLTYTPVDFEIQSLAAQLAASGFRADRPAFVAWLGVVPYLTRAAFDATLAYLQTLAPGSGLVFDYGLPRTALQPLEQIGHDLLAARVQAAGEPFLLRLTPQEAEAALAAWHRMENLGSAVLNARYFAGRQDNLALYGDGSRFISAWL
jgi:methyltransferase (TIGR00027 family)